MAAILTLGMTLNEKRYYEQEDWLTRPPLGFQRRRWRNRWLDQSSRQLNSSFGLECRFSFQTHSFPRLIVNLINWRKDLWRQLSIKTLRNGLFHWCSMQIVWEKTTVLNEQQSCSMHTPCLFNCLNDFNFSWRNCSGIIRDVNAHLTSNFITNLIKFIQT